MWPNESPQYREKRQELAEAEAQLRTRTEEVAALRRALPAGGAAKEDYVFVDVASGNDVALSKLFSPGKDTLMLYSLMYKAGDESPCVMCASLLDSLAGAASHVGDRVNLAIVAKAPAEQIAGLVKERDWNSLRFISSASNTYNQDYRAEGEEGNQLPMMHVWKKQDGEIRHFWGSEMFFRNDPNWGNQPRHVDMIWPVWNLLDLTPEGRGENWYPKNAY